MRRAILVAAALLSATSVAAQDISVDAAYIPIAPPGVMSHAAYLTLANTGNRTRSLIGVTAQGYTMAHLHQSQVQSGVAAMSMIHQLDIAPGQTVSLMPGGLHIMLMHPQGKLSAGETVSLTLHFANGEDISAIATVQPRDGGS